MSLFAALSFPFCVVLAGAGVLAEFECLFLQSCKLLLVNSIDFLHLLMCVGILTATRVVLCCVGLNLN